MLGDRPDPLHRRRPCYLALPPPTRRRHELPATASARVASSVPSVSRDATAGTMRAAALAGGAADFAGGRVEATAGHPVVRGEWLGAPARRPCWSTATTTCSRPGTSPSGTTPPFELDRATATWCAAAGSPTTRARCTSCSRWPGRSWAGGRAAAQRQVPVRGRGGDRQPAPARLPARARRRARRRPGDLRRRRDVAARASRRCRWRPRAWSSLDIVVTGADADLHSGRYGGTVANPLHALAGCWPACTGRRLGGGRRASTTASAELTDERRAEIAAVAFDEEEYRRQGLGVPAASARPARAPCERLWSGPTLEVNGLQAGGKYTVIPHRATAHVPAGWCPPGPRRVLAAVADHLTARAMPGVERRWCVPTRRACRLTGSPRSTRRSGPRRRPSRRSTPARRCCSAVIAGTLPATTLFEEALGAKTLSSPSPPPTSSTTPRTSSSASGASARACARVGAALDRGLAAWAAPAGPVVAARPREDRLPSPTVTSARRAAGLRPAPGVRPRAAVRGRAERGGRDAGGAAAQGAGSSISLHDHPVRFPADMRDTPAYNRTGRQHTASPGCPLRHDGGLRQHDGRHRLRHRQRALAVGRPHHDLGMRLADLAHQTTSSWSAHCPTSSTPSGRASRPRRSAWRRATPIENELDRLDVLYGLGIRQMGIAYSDANTLGSGLKRRATAA